MRPSRERARSMMMPDAPEEAAAAEAVRPQEEPRQDAARLSSADVVKTFAPAAPPSEAASRLLLLDEAAPTALKALLRAVRSDVLVVTYESSTSVKEVVAAAQAAHAKAGRAPLRSLGFWQAAPAELRAGGAQDASDAPPEAESVEAATKQRAAERATLRDDATQLCAALAPLLEASGRIHVLTPGVLEVVGPLHLADDDEVQFAQSLQAASSRPVAIGRGEPLEDSFQLLALDREILNITHVYFEHEKLLQWRFARNRASTGINPNTVTIHGISDAADVRQKVITYLQEVPGLYAIMIGSFLMLFVPESCTTFAASCSSRENLGTHTRFGQFVLTMNCMTGTSFVVADFFFNRRETFLINWLDLDDEYPSTHLHHVIDRYPRIKSMLWDHNTRCFHLARITTTLVVVNFIVSAAFVLRRAGHSEKVCCPGIFPGEMKTITTLLTSTMLVFMKLLRHMRTTSRSRRETMGLSSAHMLPLSYNVIDADHVDDEEDAPPAVHAEVRASALLRGTRT